MVDLRIVLKSFHAMIDILDTRMISNNAIHGSGGGIWIHYECIIIKWTSIKCNVIHI